MALVAGKRLVADDWNDLIYTINLLHGTGKGFIGYGSTQLSYGQPGDIIEGEQYKAAIIALRDIALHQGTDVDLPDPDDIVPGEKIKSLVQIREIAHFLLSNATSVNPLYQEIKASVLIDKRSNPWTHYIQHGFIVTFNSTNDARYFFNTGGQIRISMKGPSGESGHYWDELYSTSGMLIFDFSYYYKLPENLNLWATVHGPFTDPITGNTWRVRARYIAGNTENNARGSSLEIRSESINMYNNSNSVVDEFISTVSERKAISSFSPPSPNYITTISLENGF